MPSPRARPATSLRAGSQDAPRLRLSVVVGLAMAVLGLLMLVGALASVAENARIGPTALVVGMAILVFANPIVWAAMVNRRCRRGSDSLQQ